jgi:hypothetical protein
MRPAPCFGGCSLDLTEATLQGGTARSQDTRAAYCAAMEDTNRLPVFVTLDVEPVTSAPRVLRLLEQPAPNDRTPRSLDAVLDVQTAALVGATGQGKTRALRDLAGMAAQRRLLPVELQAVGHVPGTR